MTRDRVEAYAQRLGWDLRDDGEAAVHVAKIAGAILARPTSNGIRVPSACDECFPTCDDDCAACWAIEVLRRANQKGQEQPCTTRPRPTREALATNADGAATPPPTSAPGTSPESTPAPEPRRP